MPAFAAKFSDFSIFTLNYFKLNTLLQNPELQIAEQFALQTGKHFFLTGKAGTGKTTLLKNIAAKTTKNIVIVAPTGVAAINAGGVTIHSMFHLPVTSFIPSNDYVDMNVATNQRALASHLRFRKEKLRVIHEMQMLIIDEVSMVRCDILDAIDFALRTVRRIRKPFGGVQVMVIGDMHQLPPVVRDHEWAILKQYYDSPYFFDSHVWKSIDAAHVELKQIFRQSDERFLSLLNNIRHQQLEEDDYEQLKTRYKPDFQPTEEGYILLTTHNRKADSVNEEELHKLPGRTHLFEAIVKDDFPDHVYPCEKVLQLKEGAQVMFIKNDVVDGMYFNGKLAVVKKIDDGNIIVTFNDDNQDYQLKRETWENINYSMEADSDKIQKKVVGTFSQYPLRLAWAVTIHKSQGLTFDKVIIDAGQSFAAGQVYVALSRCRSLEGIVLHSLIRPNVLFGDERITRFTDSHHGVRELENILKGEKQAFAYEQLMQLFTFYKLDSGISDWKEMLMEKDIPEKAEAAQLFQNIDRNLKNIHATADKFQQQLERLLNDYRHDSKNISVLKERSAKAVEYFTEKIFTELITPLHEHIAHMAFKARVKKYVQQLQATEELFWMKVNQLYNAKFLDEAIYSGTIIFTKEKLPQVKTSLTSGKKEKGGTYNDTLDLYREGKTIEEIAAIRSLTVGTIKGHFAKWIAEGEINVYEVLPKDYIAQLQSFIKQYGSENYAAMKRELGDAFDYSDMRMVLNGMRYKKEGAS